MPGRNILTAEKIMSLILETVLESNGRNPFDPDNIPKSLQRLTTALQDFNSGNPSITNDQAKRIIRLMPKMPVFKRLDATTKNSIQLLIDTVKTKLGTSPDNDDQLPLPIVDPDQVSWDNLERKEQKYIKSLESFGKLNSADDKDQIEKDLPGIRKIAGYFKQYQGAMGLSREQKGALGQLIKKAIGVSASLKIPDSLIKNYNFLIKFNEIDVADEDKLKRFTPAAKKAIEQIKSSTDYLSLEEDNGDQTAKELLDDVIQKAEGKMPKSEEEKGDIDRKDFSQSQIRTFTNKLFGLIISTVKFTDYTFMKPEADIVEKADYQKLNALYEKYIKSMKFEKDLNAINNRLKNTESVITAQTYVQPARKNINTLANFMDIFFDCANLEEQMGMNNGGTLDLNTVFKIVDTSSNPDPVSVNKRKQQIKTLTQLFDASSAPLDINSVTTTVQRFLKDNIIDDAEIPSQVKDVLTAYVKKANKNTAEEAKKALQAIEARIEKTGKITDVNRKNIKQFDIGNFRKLKPKEIISRIFFETGDPGSDGDES